MKSQIYKTDQRIRNCVGQLEDSELSRKNVDALKNLKNEMLAQGDSEHTVNAVLQSFLSLSHVIDFNLKDASRQELLELARKINQNEIQDDKDYSVWTLCQYKKALKKFYSWDRRKESPEVIDFLNVHIKEADRPKIDPEQLMSVSDVEELINSCCNFRDKALLGLLWDSGARIGELLSLEWRDITFNEELMGLRIRDGKTGPRKIYLAESIPLVKKWRSEYPGRARSEDPVWIALNRGGRQEKRQMTYRAAAKQIRTARERTSIEERKKSNPHAWRKARATFMASRGMSQPAMNSFFGWVPGSDVSKYYIRMAQRDVKRSIRDLYPGLDPLENEGSSFLGENIPEYDQADLRAYSEP